MSERKTLHQHVFNMLSLELLIYRIHLLSPFKMLQNGQLSTTIQIKVYMCILFISYILLRISLYLMIKSNDQSRQFFLSSGNLWFSIIIFDYAYETFSFVCIVLNSLWTSAYQIKFFQILNEFDVILFDVFNVPINCFKKRARWARWVLIFGVVHCTVSAYKSVENGYLDSVFNPLQQFAYVSTAHLDYSLSVLVAIMFIHCTEMCRERVIMLKEVFRSHIISVTLTTSYLEAILQLYRRICMLIVMLNNFMGFVVLLKIGHDFSLGTSIAFLYLTTNDWGDGQGISSSKVLRQFVLTIAGTLMMAVFADFLKTEVGVVFIRYTAMHIIKQYSSIYRRNFFFFEITSR